MMAFLRANGEHERREPRLKSDLLGGELIDGDGVLE